MLEATRPVAGLRAEPSSPRAWEKSLLRLRGRACEACAQKLERKVQAIPGVQRAAATFIGGGVMSVTHDRTLLPSGEVLPRVRQTGAPALPFTAAAPTAGSPRFADRFRRWLDSGQPELICTILTALFMLGGWLAPRLGFGATWANASYFLAYLAGGIFGVQASLQSLRQWTIDVDLLMVLAALGAAFVGAPLEGAMLLFLFSLSNVLQAYAIDRTRKAIRSLMKLRPNQALTRRDGETALLPIEALVVGDLVLVRPGESIPLDGVIVEGRSALNEASLTGESMPVSKKAGDPVFAATINQTGGLEVRVTRLAKDSTIEKLIRMVEEAQSEKAETQRFLDRAEQYYAVGVIVFTLALIVGPAFFGHEAIQQSFYRAMTVMVVASPCALIISTPASILSAIGGAARRGILFKGGAHLERTATIEVVAFDKTGTLTEGKPRVTDIVSSPKLAAELKANADAPDLLGLAAAVEQKSEHPLAQAIVAARKERGLPLLNCGAFQSVSGKGASGMVAGRRIVVGNIRFLESLGLAWGADSSIRSRVETLQSAGKTCVLIGEIDDEDDDGQAQLLGAIAVADTLRKEAAAVVRELKAMGIRRVVMLTGDHHRVAAAMAQQAGVDEFRAGLLPEDKVREIKALKSIGPVAMVGDGVNDAPALATASVGIAMGAAGTDVAMETADIVLMSDNLHNVVLALAVSRQARRVVRQNLVFAVAVIAVLVVSALGFSLRLPLGVIGHEGSTVLVCLNGLRLLAFRRRGGGIGGAK